MRAILIGVAIGLVGYLSGCGSSAPDAGGAETPAEARAAIEALPFGIDLRRPPGEPDALVGTIHAEGAESRFYVFVHGDKPLRHRAMVEALGGRGRLPLEEAELTANYAFFSPVLESAALSDIVFELEEALCKQATGEACGI